MPHIFFRCNSAGKGSPGGTDKKAKNPFSSLGALLIKFSYQCITSFASLNSQSIGPAYTVLIGHSLNKNEVTTPKFPPPPRNAKNRSGFSDSDAFTHLPSASTTSASSRLSIV